MTPHTVSDILPKLVTEKLPRIPAPAYLPGGEPGGGGMGGSGSGSGSDGAAGTPTTIRPRVGLAVEDMKRHTSDEGWQLFAGLEASGWTLAGRRLPVDEVDVGKILDRLDPSVVLMQDEREWDVTNRDFRDRTARFLRTEALKQRDDIFKLTVLKDSHQRPRYHRASADRIGCHAWVVYYHPRIVSALATYVRPQHVVRTWHSIDPDVVPAYSPHGRRGCLLSGAVSGAYPLRTMIARRYDRFDGVEYLRHPGYHRNGCATPEFMKTLVRFRVAICTASVFGYALRKIVEATACGCVVVTDLPVDEVMPEIDDNLVRVRPDVSTESLNEVIRRAMSSYDPARQERFARLALGWYGYRDVGRRLSEDIERLRASYTGE